MAKRSKKRTRKTSKKVVRKLKSKVGIRKPRIKRPKAIRKAKSVYRAVKNPKQYVKRKVKSLTKKAIRKLLKSRDNFNINTATKEQLKQYVSDNIKLVNNAYSTMNRASKRAFKKAKDIFGTNEEGLLNDALTKDKKKDLFEKADILDSILDGDGVSTVAKIIMDYKTERQYKSFMKGATGKFFDDISYEDYAMIMEQLGRIQQETGYDDSGKVIQALHDYGSKYGYKTVGSIIIETLGQIRYAKDFDARLYKNIQRYMKDMR